MFPTQPEHILVPGFVSTVAGGAVTMSAEEMEEFFHQKASAMTVADRSKVDLKVQGCKNRLPVATEIQHNWNGASAATLEIWEEENKKMKRITRLLCDSVL